MNSISRWIDAAAPKFLVILTIAMLAFVARTEMHLRDPHIHQTPDEKLAQFTVWLGPVVDAHIADKVEYPFDDEAQATLIRVDISTIALQRDIDRLLGDIRELRAEVKAYADR